MAELERWQDEQSYQNSFRTTALKNGFPHQPPNLTLFPKENKVIALAKKFSTGANKPKRKSLVQGGGALPAISNKKIEVNCSLKLKKRTEEFGGMQTQRSSTGSDRNPLSPRNVARYTVFNDLNNMIDQSLNQNPNLSFAPILQPGKLDKEAHHQFHTI